MALVRVTVTPPTGAATGKVIGKATDWPKTTDTFDGRPIIPAAALAVTLNVVLGIFGAVVLAVMVADPTAMPVTGTLTVVAPDANVTDDGTVATLVLLDARLMVRPPEGAGPESVSVAFCVVGAVTESVAGVNAMVALTVTVCGLADVYPAAEALI